MMNENMWHIDRRLNGRHVVARDSVNTCVEALASSLDAELSYLARA